MKSLKATTVITLLFLLVFTSCGKVPISGRKQLNLMSESKLVQMSVAQYNQFLEENTAVSESDPRARMVVKIGFELANAATDFLKKKGAGKRVEGFDWEFNLVDNPMINAWAMPGGKVMFYTGILAITKDEVGLAVVMGHEISHAIARHGNERMSQGMALQGAGMTLDVLTSQNPGMASDIFMQSMGIGSQLGMLAYSRTHESEADKMGLVFMAMAGYDPREAPKFWERMSAVGGEKPPELMSTHPSDEKRMADLEAFMPEAMKYYKP